MKTDKVLLLFGIVIIILLAFLIVWKANILGVSESRLEQDARESQDIDSGWEVVQAIDENICAMLFYDENKEDYAYSIYLSKEGMSYGYFFRQGGSDAYIAEGVKGIIFEHKGIALLSLNQDKVCKIVTDSPAAQEVVVQVDPGKPFAIVLPIDCGDITLYDAQDNIVMLYDTYTGA